MVVCGLILVLIQWIMMSSCWEIMHIDDRWSGGCSWDLWWDGNGPEMWELELICRIGLIGYWCGSFILLDCYCGVDTTQIACDVWAACIWHHLIVQVSILGAFPLVQGTAHSSFIQVHPPYSCHFAFLLLLVQATLDWDNHLYLDLFLCCYMPCMPRLVTCSYPYEPLFLDCQLY